MATKIKSDWEQAIIDMGYNQYKSVSLIADGYNVSIGIQLLKNKLMLGWYIDCTWKGEYMNADSEIGAKFGRPMKFKFPKNIYDLQKKCYGKKAADKEKNEYESKIHGYRHYHPSARAFISHLKKTCTSIELKID